MNKLHERDVTEIERKLSLQKSAIEFLDREVRQDKLDLGVKIDVNSETVLAALNQQMADMEVQVRSADEVLAKELKETRKHMMRVHKEATDQRERQVR